MTIKVIESITARQGLAYGLLGMPLAFVALPLYVVLPNHYARTFGMPLATLGAVLLVTRLVDAVIDPLLGQLSDRLFAYSVHTVWAVGAFSALILAISLSALFFPLVTHPDTLWVWAAVCLFVTYTAYSQLGITHQSWGARLGGDELQRGRIVAWREACGLVGVVVASILPTLLGLPAMLIFFVFMLGVGWLAWTQAPRPQRGISGMQLISRRELWRPWGHASFRYLLAVFMLNGTASAIPATLVLFFIQDRLQASPAYEPLFLGTYFLCAALSIPLWLRVVARYGLARTWLIGMLLAIMVFADVARLTVGDTLSFWVVCALSGAALGTDLVLPGALLTGIIIQRGDGRQHEGSYFGWWNLATKLNLALAAGLALPLLGSMGYTPGTRNPEALQTLGLAYAVLPCILKLLAAALLYFSMIRPSQSSTLFTSEGEP